MSAWKNPRPLQAEDRVKFAETVAVANERKRKKRRTGEHGYNATTEWAGQFLHRGVNCRECRQFTEHCRCSEPDVQTPAFPSLLDYQ